MKNKTYLLVLLLLIGISLGLTQFFLVLSTQFYTHPQTKSLAIKTMSTTIAASGTIHSVNEATLHFQTGGKVVYLPFKVGDSVQIGQTIAQLDTYALQQQLTQALNTYQSTRDSFDQTQQNAQNNVLQTSQNSSVAGIQGNSTNAVNDIVKRILDENQNTLNNSVINVQLANYALQLSSLVSPFSGVITSEDITTPYVNVTPLTSFSIADPNNLVFRANVSAGDIDFVQVGAPVTLQMTGYNKTFQGTVLKIYPQQMTINGASVYQIDITSSNLAGIVQLGQNGTAQIKSSITTPTVLVPTWTILGHNNLWVLENNKAVLKKVTVGNQHGSMTEITGGLSTNDVIITSPISLVAKLYSAL